MQTQKRATKGGQTGVNGEWYEGGKFLPSTEKPKGKTTRGTGKQEIEPFVWVVSEGRQSLYRQFAGLYGVVGRDGVAILKTNDQILAYHRTTREQAQSMIDRYNAGERWA